VIQGAVFEVYREMGTSLISFGHHPEATVEKIVP